MSRSIPFQAPGQDTPTIYSKVGPHSEGTGQSKECTNVKVAMGMAAPVDAQGIL